MKLQDRIHEMTLGQAITQIRAHLHWRENSKDAKGNPESATTALAMYRILQEFETNRESNDQ